MTKPIYLYEGHFSSEGPWKTPEWFKHAGYRVKMLFLALSDVDLSLQRVVERTKYGGRYVSPTEVKNNFYGNFHHLNQFHRLLDEDA